MYVLLELNIGERNINPFLLIILGLFFGSRKDIFSGNSRAKARQGNNFFKTNI